MRNNTERLSRACFDEAVQAYVHVTSTYFNSLVPFVSGLARR